MSDKISTDTYNEARFFAISAIGYGKGFTAEEAEENYYQIQQRDRSYLAKTKAKRIEWLKDHAFPNLWLAPEGADGFTTGPRSLWIKHLDGGGWEMVREFEDTDRVKTKV